MLLSGEVGWSVVYLYIENQLPTVNTFCGLRMSCLAQASTESSMLSESGFLDLATINVLSQTVVWGCLGIFSTIPGFYTLRTNSILHF